MKAVIAENVWKMLGSRWVLRGASFTVDSGEAVLVVGPNGSGKSTLLKIVCGVWKPSRGAVKVYGADPASPSVKRMIGVVFHENVLYDELTVYENLRFYASFYGVRCCSGNRVVEGLGLSKVLDTRVGELSFGWKRRANIARAVIHSPRLLVVDEPLTGLDAEGRRAVLSLLRSILDGGGAVVAASPGVEEDLVRHLGARVLVVVDGRLVEDGAAPNLQDRGDA
jgi:ABC-type multidrug transport system ATPase subunit